MSSVTHQDILTPSLYVYQNRLFWVCLPTWIRRIHLSVLQCPSSSSSSCSGWPRLVPTTLPVCWASYLTSDLTCWLGSSSEVQFSFCSKSNTVSLPLTKLRFGHLYFLSYLVHSYSSSVTWLRHNSPSFLFALPKLRCSTWNSEFIHHLGLPASWCPARDFNGKEKGERNDWWEVKKQNYLIYYIYNLGPIWPVF